jgi:hypothetical protein
MKHKPNRLVADSGHAVNLVGTHALLAGEPVKDKPYYVRFKQLQTGRDVQGMTHAKGHAISPRFLLQILERFEITVPDFLEGLVATKKGPQPV